MSRPRGNPKWNSHGNYFNLPNIPSQYSQKLEELKVGEWEAAGVVKNGDPRGVSLRVWIKRHWRHRFVPDVVLEAMGLGEWGG